MLDLTYTTPKPKVIAGAKQDWELVIGMEIHAQVRTWPSWMRRCRGCCR
jgi:aspartyl-tRNA(Asn)/glutamyl-tRNA(Gln) amidotransferase subunit B